MGTVLVIYTGGTIGMKPSPTGYTPVKGYLASYLSSHPTFNDGLKAAGKIQAVRHTGTVELDAYSLPQSVYQESVRYCVLEYQTLVDSSSIEFEDWIKIAKTIERNYKLFDGFVVLHGTDSMAYSSSMLSFLLQHLGKTVIFTGSQIPISQLRNDAQENLLSALILAGHFVIPEVCLFFHHELFRGNRVSKINAIGFDAFASPNCLPLATVGVEIEVHWSRIHRPTTNTAFRVAQVEEVDVASLFIFPGIKGSTIRALSGQATLRGLVLHTFGSGNIPENKDLQAALAEGTQKDIVIVNITQCQVGSVMPLYAAGAILSSLGVLSGLDMTAECVGRCDLTFVHCADMTKALTKLAFLLGNADESVRKDARALISKNLKGELTEPDSRRIFEHESQAPTEARHRLADLMWAISNDDLRTVKLVLDDDTINAFSSEGSTPLHLAAKLGRVEVVKELLAHGAFVFCRSAGPVAERGHTPLFYARKYGHTKVVDLLIECGAHLLSTELQG